MNAETINRPSRLAVVARRLAYVAIALITIGALIHALENYRGKRAWDRYRQAAEARGMRFDMASHITPPVPEEQNGANTPFIQGWFPKPRLEETNDWPIHFSEASRLIVVKRQTKGGAADDDRTMTDLTAWQEAFGRLKESAGKNRKKIERESHGAPLDAKEQAAAARAILDELKIYAPVLAELRAASQRPHVRYPVDYKLNDPFSILLPHLGKIKGVIQELRLQVSAELAAGQADQAFENARLMLWLCDSLEPEAFLISQLVRIAYQQIAIQPIWEGLMEHKWSEAQLKEFQERALRMNFAASCSRSMNAERAGGATVIQNTIKRNNLGETLAALSSPGEVGYLSPASAGGQKFAGYLVPRGWLYFEMLNHSSLMDSLLTNGWDVDQKIFYPRAMDENERVFSADLKHGMAAVWKHQILARMLLPALTKSSRKFSRAQATANQLAIACALERFHKKQSGYPAALSELVPLFLGSIPNEAVSEAPMRYLRTAEGYVLYSSGWDGVDDGGALLKAKGEIEKGDWVWRMGP